MLALVVTFDVKREHAADFLKAILAQAANSLAKEPGCRQFNVCVDPEDACRILLYEVSDDQAAIERHRTTPHFAAYNATVTPMIADKQIRVVKIVSPAATTQSSAPSHQ